MGFTVWPEARWRQVRLAGMLPFITCLVAVSAWPQQAIRQENQKIQQLADSSEVAVGDVPLGPGDLLHVDVFDVPELSRDVRVSESGDISFPLIPEKLSAAGLTPFELEQKMAGVLAADGLVMHPQVSIFVKEQNSQPVSVVGAVVRPTVLQVIRPMTLLEALASAGGIADDAGPNVVITRRLRQMDPHVEQVSDKPESPVAGQDSQSTITIRVRDLLESGNPAFNIQVMGGDVVSVPRAGVIYVMGFGVAQQGEYVLQGHGDQVTVLKAVAVAHGLTSFAKANDSVIMRNDSVSGKRIEIPVHLKRIQDHKEDDVPLQSNDILFIPDSRGKKAFARGTEAALGIGTQIAVYRMP